MANAPPLEPGLPGSESPAEGHTPYVPSTAQLPEFTWSAVIVGAVLGIIFGASSMYLVLKVGMTISASIPVAVLSITLFRVFSKVFGFRRRSILENNIVQTTGSAGESIAFGVGVTMPALMLLGFEMEIGRVMLVSVLGGALGILMMIPLRRAFIVKRHDTLKYPEGTACADVLIVGEQGGATAKTVFIGFGIAAVYQFLWQALHLWKEVPSRSLSWFKGAVPSIEVNPALLGVGYIIGTRISCIMTGGGVLAYLVLIPAIHFFGDQLTGPLAPGTALISTMDADQVRESYVLYVGAGAVAAGGIYSLLQALPLIGGSLAAAFRDLRAARGENGQSSGPVRRIDRDLSMRVVCVGSLLLLLAIWILLPLGTPLSWVNLAAAVLIVLFGFLFVTVSSRLTGEIGSSSNPISGMTVATLLLTCLVFLLLGWTGTQERMMAITVAAIVCIAASNGGTTSQDLKTGYLVGATPKYQQWAILVGSTTSALAIGSILILLNNASTVYSTKNLPVLKHPLDVSQLTEHEKAPDGTVYPVWRVINADSDNPDNPEHVAAGKYYIGETGQPHTLVDPGINGVRPKRDDGTEVLKYTAPKARIMALITDGILRKKLPWTLVLLGVCIALMLELAGVPSLPFAVGVYLPLSSSTPIFVGGLMRYLADRFARNADGSARSTADSDMSPGVLLSTGYIAGGTTCAVVIALFAVASDTLPKQLSVWEYRRYTITEQQTAETICRTAAAQELGINLNTQQLSSQQGERLKELADEIKTLNSDELESPENLQPGATLKLPQHEWPALAAFSALAVFLVLVGAGWLFRAAAPPGDRGPPC